MGRLDVEAERPLSERPAARQAHLEGNPKGGYSNAPTSHLHECVVAQFALERVLPHFALQAAPRLSLPRKIQTRSHEPDRTYRTNQSRLTPQIIVVGLPVYKGRSASLSGRAGSVISVMLCAQTLGLRTVMYEIAYCQYTYNVYTITLNENPPAMQH